MAQFHPPPSSLHVTASPLPSRSTLAHGHVTGAMPFPSFEQKYPQNKHLQNLAKHTSPPKVPQPRQSSSTSLQLTNPLTHNSSKAHPKTAIYGSIEKGMPDDQSSLQLQPNMYQHKNNVAASKPLYQPEIIRIDCGSTTPVPAAPSPILTGRPHLMYAAVATPSPPPPPPPLRQSSCLTEPVEAGSPPPPSPPGMPQPMAPLLSNYPRFHDQQQCQQLLPQPGMGFQTTFQNQYPPEVCTEVQNSQHLVTNKPWGAASMTRSFDDGDIVQNYYSNMHRGNYFTHQGGTGIVRNPNGLSINNSGGGTLPRPKGLVKPRPVAKIAANPQPPLEKQSTSTMSDLHEIDMCKNAMSSFVSSNGQPAVQQITSENNHGSQVIMGT